MEKSLSKRAWPAEQCLYPALQYGPLISSEQAWPSSPATLVEMGTLSSAELLV